MRTMPVFKGLCSSLFNILSWCRRRRRKSNNGFLFLLSTLIFFIHSASSETKKYLSPVEGKHEFQELCMPIKYSFPEGCSPILPRKNVSFNEEVTFCLYEASWIWPSNDDSLHFRVSMKYHVDSLNIPWIGIGFSSGKHMVDGIDAVLAYGSDHGAKANGFRISWYDYPDPGSERNLLADGSVTHMETVDGMSTIQFKKKAKNFGIFEHDFYQSVLNQEAIYISFPIRGGYMDGNYFGKHFAIPVVKPFYFKQCGSKLVKVDGSWGEWSTWSPCSATCGSSTRTRERLCDQPAPAEGGNPCQGETTKSEPCASPQCPKNNECLHKSENANTGFQYPENCGFNVDGGTKPKCDYIVQWKWNTGTEFAEFKVYFRNTKRWSGIGFSKGPGINQGIDAVIGYFDLETENSYFENVWMDEKHHIISSSPVDGKIKIGILKLNQAKSNETEEERSPADVKTLQSAGEELFLIMTFQKNVFGFQNPKNKLNLADHNGAWWTFPVEGGEVTKAENGSFQILSHTQYKIVNSNIKLEPCVPKISLKPKIECFSCQNYNCLFRWPGQLTRCPPDVKTCQKFDGTIDGERSLLRMCGKANAKPNDDECIKGEGIVDNRTLSGTLCTCSYGMCNSSDCVLQDLISFLAFFTLNWITLKKLFFLF